MHVIASPGLGATPITLSSASLSASAAARAADAAARVPDEPPRVRKKAMVKSVSWPSEDQHLALVRLFRKVSMPACFAA